MKRVLTGITSSGRPHLGNILGAIEPGIKLSKNRDFESFFFISDLHSLTTIKDGQRRDEYRNAIAAAWLAFGFETDTNIFYRQSKVPEVCELAWYLNCFTPFPMLANAHAYKSKAENLSDINAGLFTYPVLMAADILLFDADIVPVGSDQKQHIEMTRDIGRAFNNQYGELFVIPEARIDANAHTIPGTDGRKMSKSYNNYIDIFLPEKDLKKAIMSIETDSTPLEEPKDPDTCNVFALYREINSDLDVAAMRANYLKGGYGFGHAKKELLGSILTKYATERTAFNELMKDKQLIDKKLMSGELKARDLATQKLTQVRKALGF